MCKKFMTITWSVVPSNQGAWMTASPYSIKNFVKGIMEEEVDGYL